MPFSSPLQMIIDLDVIAAASLLVNWLAQMAVHGRIEAADFAQFERVYRDSLEVRTMIQTAIAKEKEEIRRESFERGIERGIEQGKRERDRQLARTMQAEHYSLTTIAHLLQLSEADVQMLIDDAAEQ